MFITNKSKFRQLLGFVRGNDFAHAGEAEAIEMLFANLPKNKAQLILDVGSGLGETAHYVQSHDYGKITGIDVDAESVEYATKKFPNVKYFHCDALDVQKIISDSPDIIYMFNVLYVMADQPGSLKALRNFAKTTTTLALFIYVDLGEYKQSEPAKYQLENPVKHDAIEPMLREAGWQIEKQVNLNEEYKRWYQDFVDNIIKRREAIIELADENTYQYLLEKYQHLLDETQAGTLGGALVYAKPK